MKIGTTIKITGHAGMQNHMRFGSRRGTIKIAQITTANGRPLYLVRAGDGMMVGLRRNEFKVA